MEYFKLTISEGSVLIFTGIQGTRLNVIKETIRFLRSNSNTLPLSAGPKENKSFHVSIKQYYFNQFGELKTKYKKGDVAFFKYFNIHHNEYTIELLENEMANRFYINC